MSTNKVIAFYLQHYLAPSMTFIYNQLGGSSEVFNTIVLNSRIRENLTKFPFKNLYSKHSTLHEKGLHFLGKLLKNDSYYYSNINPVLNRIQKNYFQKILLKKQVSLIHAHFGPSGLEILPVARELNLPLLVTFHGYDATILIKNDIYQNNLKNLFEYASIICVSDYMKNKLIEIGAEPQKIEVIRYGASVEKFAFIKRKPLREKKENGEEINFLQVSTFIEKKGHKYTLNAFKKFIEYYPNTHLTLGGTGPLFETIKNLADELGISTNVFFPGLLRHKEVAKLMKEADVFLHHSITALDGNQEGIPNAIIEAMATGLPVIATYHAGIPEIIKDGYNGYLVNEKDVEEYLKKMIEVIESNSEIGIKARDTILRKYNLKIQNKKLNNFYEKILKL